VGNVGQDVQPGDPLGSEEILGEGILFQEYGGQDVADVDFRLLGRPGMVDRPLDHPLETEGLLQDILPPLGDALHALVEEFFQVGPEFLHFAPAALDDFDPGCIEEYGKEDMLRAHVFMTPLLGFLYRQAQGGAEVFADHGLFLFHGALERVTFFPSQLVNRGHLGFGHLEVVNAAYAGAVPMHVQHDAGGFVVGLVKNRHQNLHHELHGGVVIIEEDHPVHGRFADLDLLPGFYLDARVRNGLAHGLNDLPLTDLSVPSGNSLL
jgi:hypothetical protein